MKKLTVNFGTSKYPVYIADNIIKTLQHIPGDLLLITDTNIPKDKITTIQTQLSPKHTITLPPGENSKSLKTYESIIQTLLEKDFTKSTTIIACGGGVVGDLSGFIASTFYRGIDYIQIPTTLLAMADSSIGSKVALNINHNKNIIGAFYHPKAVYIDPTFLTSLPKRHLANGYAEIIKMALIKDASLYKALQDNTIPFETLITKALTIKKALVEQDPYDTSQRHLLNYGHTIGHALETHHYPTYLHGECIATGMKCMARNTPIESSLTTLFEKYDISTTIPYDKETLFKHIKHDKKRLGETITIALVEKPGNGFIKTININDIKQYL